MTGRQATAWFGARLFFIVMVILLLALAPTAVVHATGPVGHAPGGGGPNFLIAVGMVVVAWVAFMACYFTARREPAGNTTGTRQPSSGNALPDQRDSPPVRAGVSAGHPR